MLPVFSPTVKRSILAIILALLPMTNTFGVELIVNGDFSNAAGWGSITSDENIADWFLVDEGSFAPASQIFPSSTQGDAEGVVAMSDSLPNAFGNFEPNQTAIFQPFSVPANATSVLLSLDMFVNDWSGQSEFSAQQSARVDIVQAGAIDFSTSESTVVFNAFVGTDGGPPPNPYAPREFELFPFIEPGQDYIFRTMATAQLDWMQVGIDNVSIDAVVPEPNFHPAGLLIFWSAAMVIFSREERGISLLRIFKT